MKNFHNDWFILTGGAVAISSEGKIGVEWNSYRMAWASSEISKEMIEYEGSEIIVNYGCHRNDNFEYVYTHNKSWFANCLTIKNQNPRRRKYILSYDYHN